MKNHGSFGAAMNEKKNTSACTAVLVVSFSPASAPSCFCSALFLSIVSSVLFGPHSIKDRPQPVCRRAELGACYGFCGGGWHKCGFVKSALLCAQHRHHFTLVFLPPRYDRRRRVVLPPPPSQNKPASSNTNKIDKSEIGRTGAENVSVA